jgi:putative transposase
VRFIEEHQNHRVGRDGLRWGVESICAVLSEHGCVIAPSTYYDARRRAPSRRALRDEQLKVEITRVYEDNHQLFGARKVWLILRGQGIDVARCTVERLMRQLGIEGVRRGAKRRTTIPDEQHERPADLVERNFDPLAPNRLWVADFERHEALLNRAVVRTPPPARRSGPDEAGGSLIPGMRGRAEAALTTTGRASTARWSGSG